MQYKSIWYTDEDLRFINQSVQFSEYKRRAKCKSVLDSIATRYKDIYFGNLTPLCVKKDLPSLVLFDLDFTNILLMEVYGALANHHRSQIAVHRDDGPAEVYYDQPPRYSILVPPNAI